MTLILTCLTQEHILQVADRRLTRPDGTLYDDDTNKAVFYCGRVAVAYTGLAFMEGKPTAEWIGLCMKDEKTIQSAMNRVAKCAERYLESCNIPDKRLAIVATGWATFRGAQPIRPYICMASNFFQADSFGWKSTADKQMVVKTGFLDEKKQSQMFSIGQNLYRKERIQISRLVNRAVEHGAKKALVRILGGVIQAVARRNDERAKRVGKGMIIQLLSKKALLEQNRSIVTPLLMDRHSFLYVSPEGKTDSFQGPVIACEGTLITGIKFGKTPPDHKI